jgi:peptide methionine sulfoxide reductase MsrB
LGFIAALQIKNDQRSIVSNLFHHNIRSEDKFRSVGKWPAFRKAATNDVVKFVEDMFGGSDIQCQKCSKHVGQLFHDGKRSGDVHPEAKDRHLVESAAVNFEPSNPDEPAPQLPSGASSIKLNVSETIESQTTPPLGAPQAGKSTTKGKLNNNSNKAALSSSGRTTRPKDKSEVASKENVDIQLPSKTIMGAVAVAALAIVTIGGYLGYRRYNNKR